MSTSPMGEVGNDTQFAKHYVAASTLLMQALSDPRRATFQEAMNEALLAMGAAYAPMGNMAASTEYPLAQSLAGGIHTAGVSMGVVV